MHMIIVKALKSPLGNFRLVYLWHSWALLIRNRYIPSTAGRQAVGKPHRCTWWGFSGAGPVSPWPCHILPFHHQGLLFISMRGLHTWPLGPGLPLEREDTSKSQLVRFHQIPGADNRVETQDYKLKGHSTWTEIPLKTGFCLRIRMAHLYSERLRLLKESSITHWFIPV